MGVRRVAACALLLLGACDDTSRTLTEPQGQRPEVYAPAVLRVADDSPVTEPPVLARGADESAANTLSLVFSGDLVLNPQTMALFERDPHSIDRSLSAWAAQITPSDVTYLNLEMPLVDDLVPLDSGAPAGDAHRPQHAPILGGTAALADAIERAGVDVVSLANNHAYDQGHAGLSRTIAALDARAIAHAGAGAESTEAFAPAVLRRGALRVAYLSATEALNQHPRAGEGTRIRVAMLRDEERLSQALREAHEHADLVVLAVHWGRDFAPAPTRAQRRLAARFIEAGADLIVGTGPHVLHPVERTQSPRGDALVIYSLGNLLSGMGQAYRIGHDTPPARHPANAEPAARDVALLRVIARVDGRVRIDEVRAEHFWTLHERSTDGAPSSITLIALRDADEEVRLEREPIMRQALGPVVDAVVDEVVDPVIAPAP